MKALAIALTVQGLCVLAGSAAAQEAVKQPPAPAFLGPKLPVADFDRSVAYYTTFLPLRKGQVYNDHEMGLSFSDPASTALIILWLNTCAKPRPTPAEREAAAAKIANPVQKELQLCASKFVKGGGWLVIRVPDLRKTAAALTAAGYPAPLNADSHITLTKDPDGNVVEIIQQ